MDEWDGFSIKCRRKCRLPSVEAAQVILDPSRRKHRKGVFDSRGTKRRACLFRCTVEQTCTPTGRMLHKWFKHEPANTGSPA